MFLKSRVAAARPWKKFAVTAIDLCDENSRCNRCASPSLNREGADLATRVFEVKVSLVYALCAHAVGRSRPLSRVIISVAKYSLSA